MHAAIDMRTLAAVGDYVGRFCILDSLLRKTRVG